MFTTYSPHAKLFISVPIIGPTTKKHLFFMCLTNCCFRVKKVKAMLPIKTKDGLKERHIELEENADEEEEEEVPQPKV